MMLTVLGAVVCWLASGCSAVFYSHDEDFAYGVTAAHCQDIKEGGVVNAVIDGRSFGCRVVSVDRSRDLALIKCDRKHVGEVSCPIVPVRVGERVLLAGYPKGKAELFDGTLTDRTLFSGDSTKVIVAGDHEVVGGFSGGGMFTETGLCGVVTHGVNQAGVVGGGCSVIDQIISRGVDRAAVRAEESISDVLPISNPRLRDFIGMLIGWFLRFYFPGSSMVTKQVLDERVAAASRV